MLKRFTFFCCFVLSVQFFCSQINAQKIYVKTDYFDNSDDSSSENSAISKDVYYKLDNHWQIDKYSRDSLLTAFHLEEEQIVPDTTGKNLWYKYTYFYKNGKKKEYRYTEDTITTYAEHYSEKGKKDGAAIWVKGKLTSSKGWDDKGKLIPNFIYEKEAEFPTGSNGWKQHIFKTIHPDVASENGAPAGKNYTVIVSFIVDKDGSVKQVKAENDSGYHTAEEAERVVRSSVKWKPAIMLNKPVVYRQRQQITFQVTEEEQKVGEIKVAYLDQSFQKTDSTNAIFKSVGELLNDSTMEIRTYLIRNSVLVLESKGITSSNGDEYVFYKQYDIQGKLGSEMETVNKKRKKATTYHPNGTKAEEIIFGIDTDLPIKSTRWDENGKLIP